jgi:transcriptional regulator with XRE-family HTH domain
MAPPATARAKIDAAGPDWCIEQIAEGRSTRDIAQELGVNQMSLLGYLRDNVMLSARVDEAFRLGAARHEADAVAVLRNTYSKLDTDQPHPHASALAALAKEMAQASWRQASMRDARYSDRRTSDVQITVTDVRQISTAQLERIVAEQAQALTLNDDGTVDG